MRQSVVAARQGIALEGARIVHASFPMNFRDLNVPLVALHLFGCTKR
jgi:hypothetical protein